MPEQALDIHRTIPGPKSQALFAEEQRYISPGIQRYSLLAQLAIESAEGSLVRDVDGNTYIDFVAGIGVCSLGHSHPKYVAAMEDQLRRVIVGSYTSANRLGFLKLLATQTPGDLNRTQLYSSGAEAVEAALRLARAYTKKFEVIGFWGGFHGKTGGVMPLIGSEFKQGWGPLAAGFHLSPYPDPYRHPFGGQEEDSTEACLDFLRKLIRYNTAGSIAAIIIEPMQGTAGNVIPPMAFLRGVREIATEYNALLIMDEMITGFGRTGKMFGSEHAGVIPDIMLIGKGMGSGYPISGLISTEEITQAVPFSKPSSSSSSYGGNPLAATAAFVTLRTILEERLVENAAEVGTYMLHHLQRLQEQYEFLGDVRGKGLFIGLDLVKDRKTREPLDQTITEQIYRECLRRGLLTMAYTDRVRINPPLSLPKHLAQRGVEILAEVFEWVERRLAWHV